MRGTWLLPAVIGSSLALVGCYSAGTLREKPPLFTLSFPDTPLTVGECIKSEFLFQNDFPLETALDHATGSMRVTYVIRNPYSPPIYYWEILLLPANGVTQGELRSASSIQGPFAEQQKPAIDKAIKSCHGAMTATHNHQNRSQESTQIRGTAS